MKKILLLLTILCITFLITDKAEAQWAVGASYEVRDESPTNGFGVRVERGFLDKLPIVDFNMRAHFSYFNENNAASLGSAQISGDFESFDYGLALTVGAKIVMAKPYVGFGIGSERFDFESGSSQNNFQEDNFYWNGFGGVELELIPLLNPFVEYRITNLTDPDQVTFDNVGRVAFGINLRF